VEFSELNAYEGVAVEEKILTTGLRGDETETFVSELLDCALLHWIDC